MSPTGGFRSRSPRRWVGITVFPPDGECAEDTLHHADSAIAIAKNLQLRTIAEGVETEDQARVLRALGCRLHQGYLYSRPLPAARFECLFI